MTEWGDLCPRAVGASEKGTEDALAYLQLSAALQGQEYPTRRRSV